MKIAKLFRAITLVATLLVVTVLVAQTGRPRVLVIVTSADHFKDGHPTGLWLEEFAVPYEILVGSGVDVTVSSPKGGNTPIDPRSKPAPEKALAWQNASQVLTATKPLTSHISADSYDAIFLPGGHGPMFDLAEDPRVANIVSDFARKGKIIAAICHGPAGLIGAKQPDGRPFVQDKRLTGFTDAEEQARNLDKQLPFSLQQRLTGLGANFQAGPNFQSHAEQDGNLITGQNPQSSEAVGKLLLQALQTRSATASIR